MIDIIFLIFTIASAQRVNERRRSLQTDDSMLSKQRPYNVHEQPTEYQEGKIYGLRNNKINTAHYVNTSKTDNKWVKIYGEANPSKTDEHLLDVETNTQIMKDYLSPSTSKLSGGSIHELSPSGYGPPEEQPKVADDEAEVATEMQESLHMNVENPYDGIPEAEQRATFAQISATSNAKEESKLSPITTIEQAIISSEATTSTTESEERFGRIEEDIIESDLNTEGLRKDGEAFTEVTVATDEGSIEIVTKLSEASIDGQKSDAVSSIGYGASTEPFESRSISTEISASEGIKIEDEGKIGGYDVGDESMKIEKMPKTEVQEIPSKDAKFTSFESVTESSISDWITKTQIKSVSQETGAADFEYGIPSETPKESSGITERLPEVQSITSGVEETADSTVTSTIIAKGTKYIEKADQITETSDLSSEGIHPSQKMINETKISGYSYETETNAHQNSEQSTSFETEMSADESTLATVEVTTKLFTSSITSSTPASIFYNITEGDKILTSSVIESAGGIPGYETFSEPEISKAGLPGLNREEASQLAKSIEEATTLSRSTEGTEMTSGKASEDMVTESEDLKSPAKLVTSSIEVSETTEFFKKASPIPAEQLSGYDAVAPEYTAKHTEATELQRKSEGTEAASIIPYDTETGSTEDKAISSEVTATSNEAFTVAGSVENGATELSSESKEETIASEGMVPVKETTEISKSREGLAGYGEMLSSVESNAEASSKTIKLQKLDEETTIASGFSERSSILSETEFMKTETGPSIQVSSREHLTESGITATEILEITTQPNEWEAKTNGLPSMIPEKPVNYNEEILTPEVSIEETNGITTAVDKQTISRETVVGDKTIGYEKQPSGYGESLVATDDSHELSKEIILKTTEATTKFSFDNEIGTTGRKASTETERIESSLFGKISDESFEQTTVHLTSSQDVVASEAASETDSTSVAKIEYTDTRTGAEDFGYGGRGEEAITEKEY
ncbi:unnamed protein product, partial [Onchocerca flexuosa]|uniref:ShKT domain-containing protein n=1 Tax=Onchocerca flexuosa TaxID=387005 RepID=A0A183H9S0_9BILA